MQKTILNPIRFSGIGVHSGSIVNVRMVPACGDHGIRFVRIDLEGNNEIIANYSNVVDTKLCTVIANKEGAKVSTIEHLMSALWGCGIDNVIIEIDAEEVPIMDGSSAPFVSLIEKTGTLSQPEPTRVLEILKPVTLEYEGKTISIEPNDCFAVDLKINFEDSVIGEQEFSYSEDETSYNYMLSRARTFGFAKDIELLRKAGLAKGASLSNAVGIDENGVMNKEGLRYENEFSRHKVLDCIGDLYLAGLRIKGKVKAFKAGHALNNMILHKLFENRDCFRIILLSTNQLTSA